MLVPYPFKEYFNACGHNIRASAPYLYSIYSIANVRLNLNFAIGCQDVPDALVGRTKIIKK